MKLTTFTLIVSLLSSAAIFAQNRKFDFGSGVVKKGYTQVLPESFYSNQKGFGFLPGAILTAVANGHDPLKGDYITSNKPFYFSVNLPEGDYNVKVILGDTEGTSEQTIRAECRRLMRYKDVTNEGEIIERNFTVHIRRPEIKGTMERVGLKPREYDFFHWDDQLTLEFNGAAPKVAAIEITKAKTPVHIFLAGNSTVVDQYIEPYAAWGQMLPSFLKPGKVSVANYAESGETLSGFIKEQRLKKIFSEMKRGDYVFIEFGHNDQKQKGEGIGAFTSYKRDLKNTIVEIRKRGGNPVIVTSIQRRNFNDQGKINETLGDYPEAGRQSAREENVPLIDLNKMTKSMYEAWGSAESEKAFAFTDHLDNTHPNNFGAYEMAKCVVKGITENIPALAKYVVDFDGFDPAKPDHISSFYWPASPTKPGTKPDGN